MSEYDYENQADEHAAMTRCIAELEAEKEVFRHASSEERKQRAEKAEHLLCAAAGMLEATLTNFPVTEPEHLINQCSRILKILKDESPETLNTWYVMVHQKEKAEAELDKEKEISGHWFAWHVAAAEEENEIIERLEAERDAALEVCQDMLPYMENRGAGHPMWDVVRRAKILTKHERKVKG